MPRFLLTRHGCPEDHWAKQGSSWPGKPRASRPPIRLATFAHARRRSTFPRSAFRAGGKGNKKCLSPSHQRFSAEGEGVAQRISAA